MSTQSELNTYPQPYVLYYCNYIQSDSTVYQTDCSDVCTLYYDEFDDYNIAISGWLIIAYGAPSTATLLTYALADVLEFYNNFYTLPQAIYDNQPYGLTSAKLAAVRADNSMLGYVVYDDTNDVTKTWSGSDWLTNDQMFLPLVGGTMAGDIDCDGNDIDNVGTLTQTTPCLCSSWSSDSVSLAFSANTPRVLDITNFTEASDPTSEFTLNTSTGEHTYTGSVTQWFSVCVNISVTKLVPMSTQTLTFYLSKNGSTTINGKRARMTFFVAGLAETVSVCLTSLVQLATNDTVQIGARYTSTVGGISFSDCSYEIAAI